MAGDKNFGNFEKIKQQMLEAKQKAENNEKPVEAEIETPVKDTVTNSVDGSVEAPVGASNEAFVKKDVDKPVSKSNGNSSKKSVDRSIKKDSEKAIKKSQQRCVDNTIEEYVEQPNEMVIKFAVKPKVKKKAVNYYISLDVIDKVKETAEEMGMKDSNFLEELLRQVLQVSN